MGKFKILSIVVCALFSISGRAEVAEDSVSLTKLQSRLKELKSSYSDVNSKIEFCKSQSFIDRNFNCITSRGSGSPKEQVNKLTPQAAEISREILAVQKKIEAQDEKISDNKNLNSLSKSFELKGRKFDAGFLLMDAKLLETNLKASGLQLSDLEAQMDKTLIGAYTKYVVDKAMSSKKICEAVKTCSSVTSLQNDINDTKKQVKGFEEWKNETQASIESAAAKASAPPPAQPAAATQPVKAAQ